MTDREVMRLALDTLERTAIRLTQGGFVLPAIDALRVALAQQQAEPVVDVQAEREAIIDIVAMHGGSVEIEAAIRARGKE